MSSDNIFKTISKVNYKVNSSNLFKDRSSPYHRPYSKPKKQEPLQPNSLFDVDSTEQSGLTIIKNFIDRIILFFMGLFGKQKEWQEARTRLHILQKRIQTFEDIIKKAGHNSPSKNIKNYRV